MPPCPLVPPAAAPCRKQGIAAGFSVEKEQCQGYSALQCSHELAQGAVAFPVDLAACASRVLAVVLCKRRLYREFPCFLAYVFYEIAEFILLFTLYLFALYSVAGVTANQYAYAYSATLMFNIALRFGVIDEVSKDLFRESQFLKVAARRSLLCVTGLLLGVGVLLAVYAPGDNSVRWFAGVLAVSRGAAMVQSGLLLSLLLFSRFLGLSWRRPAFGIALGLGVLTSVYLAIYALRAEFTSEVAAGFLEFADQPALTSFVFRSGSGICWRPNLNLRLSQLFPMMRWRLGTRSCNNCSGIDFSGIDRRLDSCRGCLLRAGESWRMSPSAAARARLI